MTRTTPSRGLKAGIFLPPFHSNDDDPLILFERDFELMQWLDKLGYAEAWIGEHHSGGFETYADPCLFIATAAERTRHIRLGTGVMSLPYHHPLIVAERIVQLDYQTRGRAMFGFGPGMLPSDAKMLGIDPADQRDRMADSVDLIVRLLAGEVITKTTDWYNLTEARLQLRPFSNPRPHLAVTSTVTSNGARLAGRHDLGLLCVAASAAQGFGVLDANWALANEEAAKDGRVMDRANLRIMAPFHLAETRDKAMENCRRGFAAYEEYGFSVRPEGPAAIGLKSLEDINESRRGVIGTPDEALAVLENFWAKTGGFGSILMLAHDWADWEATKRSYELFARYVLPKFNARNAWRVDSMAWLRANREENSARSKAAVAKFNERTATQKSKDAAE
jgi:limonene 1,2-monooxygenase